MSHWSQNLSYVTIGILVVALVIVAIGYLVPMNAKKTRYIGWIGMLLMLIVSINSSLLYLWQHYWR